MKPKNIYLNNEKIVQHEKLHRKDNNNKPVKRDNKHHNGHLLLPP